MTPRSRRLRSIGLALICLVSADGCARVHSRQWGYPNGRKGLTRVAKPRSPRVDLQFEPNPVPVPAASAVGSTTRLPVD